MSAHDALNRNRYGRPRWEVQEDGCWYWVNYVAETGYGRLNIKNTVVYAHRWVWEQLQGPIPDGLEIDHLCRVRRCVNPDHLEPVTPQVNMLRSTARGGETHCVRGHEFTEENTYRDKRTGWRKCRHCHRDYQQERARRGLRKSRAKSANHNVALLGSTA
jgi:hypothetical protein